MNEVSNQITQNKIFDLLSFEGVYNLLMRNTKLQYILNNLDKED